MASHVIYYRSKETQANTVYCQLKNEDANLVITKLIQIQCYMGELALTKNAEIRKLVAWWTTSDKALPYNRYLRRHNSPQSFVSGVLNNMLFGEQRDFSLVQLRQLEDIIAGFNQIASVLKADRQYHFQARPNYDDIQFQEEFWVEVR